MRRYLMEGFVMRWDARGGWAYGDYKDLSAKGCFGGVDKAGEQEGDNEGDNDRLHCW